MSIFEGKKKFGFLYFLKMIKSLVTADHLVICLNLGLLGEDMNVCFHRGPVGV